MLFLSFRHLCWLIFYPRCAVNTTAEGRKAVETALEGFCDSLPSSLYEESSHVKVYFSLNACWLSICDDLGVALLLREWLLRRNPPGNWVIFSGQKTLYQNNLRNFLIFLHFSCVGCQNLRFIFSGSHKKFSLVLLQMTNYIFSSWKMWKRMRCALIILARGFWPLKIKITQFPDGFCLQSSPQFVNIWSCTNRHPP